MLERNIDVEIIKDEEKHYPQELVLEGILIKEELISIIDICKSYVKENRCVPLFINFNGNEKYIGKFELTFEKLKELDFLGNYNLTLVDNVKNRSVNILSKDSPLNGDSYFKLITIV